MLEINVSIYFETTKRAKTGVYSKPFPCKAQTEWLLKTAPTIRLRRNLKTSQMRALKASWMEGLSIPYSCSKLL